MSGKTRFVPIRCSFDESRQDEQATQDAFEDYVGGRSRAERLSRLWSNSYATGSQYDKVFNKGAYRSKEDVFRRKALAEGFFDEDVDAFLTL